MNEMNTRTQAVSQRWSNCSQGSNPRIISIEERNRINTIPAGYCKEPAEFTLERIDLCFEVFFSKKEIRPEIE
jgi:hypothetical protein